MRIGNFIPVSRKHEVFLTMDETAAAALPDWKGPAWRQVVYNAVREEAREKYPHVVALVVMEQLIESLLTMKGVHVTEKANTQFAKYQKIKSRALRPGTDAEGRTAAKLALRTLEEVLEELL